MKNLFNIILVLFTSVLIFSCRGNDVPEDVHDHEEIEKITLTVIDKADANSVQNISYIGGIADKKLDLENGKTYTVKLDFYVKHGEDYENVLEELLHEKDEHFVTYEFGGVSVNLVRTADDITRTDGKRLGLRTEWNVTSAPVNANVNIKLYHLPTSVNQDFPSVTNQQGSATGGEADVNALIGIQ